MVCRHWLEEPAQGPITKWERGKYSRLDPCHLLTLHRSKTVSVWGHGWGWTPSTQMSTNENLIGFAIYAALPRGHQAATCSFCHQNHCVFPSWSILAHGEHRPAGSLSWSLTAGTLYWGFALWQSSGYSWECHCIRMRGLCFNKWCCLWVLV